MRSRVFTATTKVRYAAGSDPYDATAARLKWVEDWLVTRGYLAGDSRKHLRYPGLPDQEIDRRRQRLELEITPLPKEE